jgi:hypothetical protein
MNRNHFHENRDRYRDARRCGPAPAAADHPRNGKPEHKPHWPAPAREPRAALGHGCGGY